VSDLLTKIRGSIGCLYNLAEMIGTLDMLLSFAHYRTTCECGECVRYLRSCSELL